MGKPEQLRVLGIFTGPTTDSVVEGEQKGMGALEELLNLPEGQAEVRGLPSLTDQGISA